MDVFSPQKRSEVMALIRSKDTKPEIRLRKALFALGFRYRKNVRGMAGTPDIVLPKYKYIIQVRGCFWHVHGCSRAKKPTANPDYWLPKLDRNVARDQSTDEALRALGWRVKIVWECEILSGKALVKVVQEIAGELVPT